MDARTSDFKIPDALSFRSNLVFRKWSLFVYVGAVLCQIAVLMYDCRGEYTCVFSYILLSSYWMQRETTAQIWGEPVFMETSK